MPQDVNESVPIRCYPTPDRMFELLANIALTLPRQQADPIGIMDSMRSLLPDEGFDESRNGVIEVWKRRKSEYPWSCPFK